MGEGKAVNISSTELLFSYQHTQSLQVPAGGTNWTVISATQILWCISCQCILSVILHVAVSEIFWKHIPELVHYFFIFIAILDFRPSQVGEALNGAFHLPISTGHVEVQVRLSMFSLQSSPDPAFLNYLSLIHLIAAKKHGFVFV
mgnify:CR=1 FL=1